MTYPLQNRFRLFREHKYIFHVFSNVLQKVATADFADLIVIENMQNEVNNLLLLHKSHAEYEETRIGKLLLEKGSKLFQQTLEEHHEQDAQFSEILERFDEVKLLYSSEARFFEGYKIYLDLRKFFADLLEHFDYEERVIMAELQSLFSDDEIQAIDHISYKLMLPEQLVHMMQVLVPHFNHADKMAFLHDMLKAEKEKFLAAWSGLKPLLSEDEVSIIEQKLPSNEAVPDLKDIDLKYPWEQKSENSVSQVEFHKQNKS